MLGSYERLFDLTVQLMRGESLKASKDGVAARAFLDQDGWHVVEVGGREIVRGCAYDVAEAWLAVERITSEHNKKTVTRISTKRSNKKR